MGRKPIFYKGQLVRAAMEILAEGGPGEVAMKAVADRVGCPIGSLYHRFPSRDKLMAEMWITVVEEFQGGFLERLEADDFIGAALHTPKWVRRHTTEARVLFLYRREDLLTGDWPEDLKNRAARLAAELDDGIRSFTRRYYGEINSEKRLRVGFALTDAPLASVRRYLEEGRKPPKLVDDLLLETVKTILRKEK